MPPSGHLLPGTLASLRTVKFTDSFYWIPSATDFPGIDAILGDDYGNLYAVQATMDSEHESPAEGLKKVWSYFEPTVRQWRPWHSVIVAQTQQSAQHLVTTISAQLAGTTLPMPVTVWGCIL